jgi:hypothetical protein
MEEFSNPPCLILLIFLKVIYEVVEEVILVLGVIFYVCVVEVK